MDEKTLIVKQQLEIESLKEVLKIQCKRQKAIHGVLYNIGAPLNDNVLQFSYEQRIPLHRIARINELHTVDISFQQRVWPWLERCFGVKISGDKIERNHRFLEESIELVQACGCTSSEAHQLVDYVFNRPIGEKSQEVGGVMVTLAALCLANDVNMEDAGYIELHRIWGKMDKIRKKQAAKPKHSPLPE